MTAVNDAPVVATSAGAPPVYTENGTAVAIDAGLVVADADDTMLAGATGDGRRRGSPPGQDVLAFTAGNGITGSYDAATGVLSLVRQRDGRELPGGAAVGDLRQHQRRSVDGGAHRLVHRQRRRAASSPATRSITVTAVNDAPVVITSGSATAYVENAAAVVVDAGIAVADVDSARLAGATVTISAAMPRARTVSASSTATASPAAGTPPPAC